MEGEAPIYVRFVTAVIDPSSLKRRGVFQAAADLIESKLLPAEEARELKEIERWFDKNLREPARLRAQPTEPSCAQGDQLVQEQCDGACRADARDVQDPQRARRADGNDHHASAGVRCVPGRFSDRGGAVQGDGDVTA
jgi:hypothetical protein